MEVRVPLESSTRFRLSEVQIRQGLLGWLLITIIVVCIAFLSSNFQKVFLSVLLAMLVTNLLAANGYVEVYKDAVSIRGRNIVRLRKASIRWSRRLDRLRGGVLGGKFGPNVELALSKPVWVLSLFLVPFPLRKQVIRLHLDEDLVDLLLEEINNGGPQKAPDGSDA
jgi:hypothetical protein